MGEGKPSLAERLKRESHRISALILNSDLNWVDIAIQIGNMRELCLAETPDQGELFEAIYTRRFERLWQQWRATPPDENGSAAKPAWLAELEAQPSWPENDSRGGHEKHGEGPDEFLV